MEEAPGAEEAPEAAPASRAATKKRSREDRDAAGASKPPSGLDAWAEEATVARVAVAAFGDAVPPLPPAEAFKQLMASAVSSNHSKTVVKDSFEDKLERDETKRVLALHENVRCC